MKLNNLNNLNQLAQTAQKKQKHGKFILTVPVIEVISKEQVRKRFRNLEELGNSIIEDGQQSPIIVSPKNSDGKYVIQKGERRWRACKIKKILEIDIVVNDKYQTNIDETAGELVENIQRDDLTPMEIAKALHKFVEEGWQKKDIAKRIGKNTSFVSSHLSLLKMPDCVRNLYDNEITSDTETLNNLRQLFQIDEKRCMACCDNAFKYGITRKQSRLLLNNIKNVKKISDLKIKIESDKNTEESIQNNSDWKEIDPRNLIVTVILINKEDNKNYMLMTDRVSTSPDFVWIKSLDLDEDIIEVSVNSIQIFSVKTLSTVPTV